MAFPLALIGLIPNLLGYWQKKQEMQLRWWELIINVLSDLVMFTIKHIRIILIGLILGYCLLKYIGAINYGKSENKLKIVAEKALAARDQADAEAEKKRKAENLLNSILAQKKTDAKESQYQAELAAIYAKQKGLENEVAVNKRDITNWRQRVRLQLEAQAFNETTRLSSNDESGFASADSDAAISRPAHECEAEVMICKEAGAICAADYNFCKSYVDIQQSILGVEND